MISDEIRKNLQDIIGGALIERKTDRCTAIRNLLCEGFEAGPTVKSEFESKSIIKERQTPYLKAWAQQNGLWLHELPTNSRYLTRGGEAEVYLSSDKLNVFKVNSGIYYATWTEFFNSLLIHNLLFESTEYSFVGFIEKERLLCAVLQQPFIEGEQANLDDIRELLTFNGFQLKVRQDYFNTEFGLALEDMHDENVIVKEDVLFFIDTVFYVMSESK